MLCCLFYTVYFAAWFILLYTDGKEPDVTNANKRTRPKKLEEYHMVVA
jgi:hypothetical protein